MNKILLTVLQQLGVEMINCANKSTILMYTHLDYIVYVVNCFTFAVLSSVHYETDVIGQIVCA